MLRGHGSEGSAEKLVSTPKFLFVKKVNSVNRSYHSIVSPQKKIYFLFNLSRAIADAMLYARNNYMDGKRSLLEVLQK